MKVSCAVLLLLGCGTNGEALLPGELDSVDLAPSPGWPDAVAARSVRASFRTAITALDVDPAGRVWLLRDEFSNASQLDGTPVLERYAPTGHLERRIAFAAYSRVPRGLMRTRGGWIVLGAAILTGCSALTPAERAQRNYEQATGRCWFRHGYDEAREEGPGVGTSAATGTTDSAIDVALRECLAMAAATQDRELAEANALR